MNLNCNIDSTYRCVQCGGGVIRVCSVWRGCSVWQGCVQCGRGVVGVFTCVNIFCLM